jgi:hypothetical protein
MERGVVVQIHKLLSKFSVDQCLSNTTPTLRKFEIEIFVGFLEMAPHTKIRFVT